MGLGPQWMPSSLVMASSMSIPSISLDRPWAVSYTHLDVYKRQTLSGYQIQLKSRWNRISGKAQGTGWSHEIEGKRFRPEAFLRKITLIEGLGEEDGD